MQIARPLIGITSGLSQDERYLSVYRGMADALLACGALPVLLPLTEDVTQLSALVDAVDGVVFSGGGDLDPLLFGECQRPECGTISPARDAMELPLARMLLSRRDKPVLGICRGFQVLAVAAGGSIYQDLPSQYPGEVLAHRQKQPETYPCHPVDIRPDSRLAALLGQTRLLVNSLHHQAVRQAGAGMTVCATAPDGVIEAAEAVDHPFCLGVQWHPERMWQQDEGARRIFTAFVEACRVADDEKCKNCTQEMHPAP